MRAVNTLLGLVTGAFLIASCSAGTPSNNTTSTGGSTSGGCQQGYTSCNGACVNTKADSAHCGNCTTSCSTSQTCNSGVCACVAGLTACGASCVNTVSDGNNCGACGAVCSGGQVCSQNKCSSSCAGTETKCGTSCVNAQTDSTNCGACGTSCTGGRTCSSGACSCAGGQQFCNNQCTDTATNFSNCGSCGRACATGQSCSGGQCIGGTGTGGAGGTTGSGGSGGVGNGGGGTTSTGGATAGGGGIAATGGANTAGAPSGGSAGAGTAGTTGVAGNRACPPTTADVISDFEEGTGVMIKQGTPMRTGWWYDYPNPVPSGTMLSPTPSMMAIPVEPSGDTAMCNKYALHVKGSGFGTAPNNYVGFGAAFLPMAPPSQLKTPYDVSSYTGISFKIKSGSGTPPAVYVELLTKESQPAESGGTATADTIDKYNTRGHMLVPPYIPTALSTAWQTVTIPFGTLVPRWVPAAGAANACPAPGGSVPKCQAAKFVPGSVLGLQFSMYTDAGFPKPAGSTAGTFDLWVDDVQFVKADMGLPARAGFPLAGAGSVGSCAKPAGADAKYLVTAYDLWKQNFVRDGNRVIRPENGNDTVSEGIAYGMLIAVNMNDKALFDGLYGYWKGHKGAGTSTAGLMTWCIPAGGGSCAASGGSATDADEDAAFALLQAGKVWGGTYKADAMGLIADIWEKDIDKTSLLPTGGSNYPTTSMQVTNASYFAPAFYKAFKAAGDTHNWDGVVTAVYGVINNASIAGSHGLFPAWCTNNCTAVGSNGAATDGIYQYDSHRVPMRIGMDYCWNAEARARDYVNKTTAFFGGNANAGLNGVGRIFDLYQLNGNSYTGAGPNSASIIGTAAVGAMASSAGTQPFLNDAYQAVFDMVNRATLAPVDAAGKTPYSYYNATVGMLSLLVLTGNFSH